MAVINVREIHRGRDGQGSLEETTYTRVFRVWTSTGSDEASVILTYLAGSPWNLYPGAAYPQDSRAWCTGARPTQDLGPLGWLVTATYSTKRERAERPEDDPIKISWDEEDYDVVVQKNRNGKAVLNSAGDYPNPALTAQDSILICTIEANVAALPTYLRTYRKAINQAAFVIDGLTVSAKHARVRRISLGQSKYRGTFPFRDVRIELAITDNDEDDWELRFLDRGFRKKVSNGATPPVYTREKIVSDDGTEPTEPVLLNGSGAVLADPTPDNAVFIEVPFYRLKQFIGNIPGCTAPP